MRTILVLDLVPLKLVAGTIRQSWISVYHETLYQRQPSGLWPHTLYGEVVSTG